MDAHEIAKNLYLNGKANAASSILLGLKEQGLIDFSQDLLQSTLGLEQGLGRQQETCSCLIAAAMAAGLAITQPAGDEAKRLAVENLCSKVVSAFRDKYQTTRCADLINGYPENTNARKLHCSEILEFVTHTTASLLIQQELTYGSLSLTRFIELLNNLPDSELSPENVMKMMERVKIEHAEIEKCLVFSESSYARNLFYKNDRFEVLVMCWGEDQKSAIHNHDLSFSVEKIFSGKILCTNYQQPNLDIDEIKETDAILLTEGNVICGRQGDIHRIETVESSPAVSIHFYSPPLKQMKCFNLSNNTAQWVKLNYLYIYRPEIWQSLESCYL